MHVEKSKVMKISMKPYPIPITIDKNQMDNVEYLERLFRECDNKGGKLCTRY